MRLAVFILAVINGGFMLIDGLYVMLNGKYIGPEKPGPWASLLSPTGIDVFKLGPVFVIFGVAWLGFAAGFIAGAAWARLFGMILAVLTLWYLPFGTAISIAVLPMLAFGEKN